MQKHTWDELEAWGVSELIEQILLLQEEVERQAAIIAKDN